MKYLDRIANIAVLVAVVVFLTVFLGKQFALYKYKSNSAQALVGKSVGISEVNFGGKHTSFVLALSTSCHFCKDSLPFYKRLSQQSEGKVGVIAVLPQSYTESSEYIQQAGISATRVISGDLSRAGVYATPTVLLVNAKGKIQKRMGWDARRQNTTASHLLYQPQLNSIRKELTVKATMKLCFVLLALFYTAHSYTQSPGCINSYGYQMCMSGGGPSTCEPQMTQCTSNCSANRQGQNQQQQSACMNACNEQINQCQANCNQEYCIYGWAW